jgi:uncharacterized protein
MKVLPIATIPVSAQARIAAYDWNALMGELDGYGCAILPRLLTADESRSVAALYPDESQFRSRVHGAAPLWKGGVPIFPLSAS